MGSNSIPITKVLCYFDCSLCAIIYPPDSTAEATKYLEHYQIQYMQKTLQNLNVRDKVSTNT